MKQQENILSTTSNILNESINTTQQLINYKHILINSTTNKGEQIKIHQELNILNKDLIKMKVNGSQINKDKLDTIHKTNIIKNACNKNSNLLDKNSYI